MKALKEVSLSDTIHINSEDHVRYIREVMINHISYYNTPYDHEECYTNFYSELLDDTLGFRIYARIYGGYKIPFDVYFEFDNVEDPYDRCAMLIYYVDAEGVKENQCYLKFCLSESGVAELHCPITDTEIEYDVTSVQGCNEMLVYSLMQSPFFHFMVYI